MGLGKGKLSEERDFDVETGFNGKAYFLLFCRFPFFFLLILILGFSNSETMTSDLATLIMWEIEIVSRPSVCTYLYIAQPAI